MYTDTSVCLVLVTCVYCGGMYVSHSVHLEVRRQLVGVGSFLPIHETPQTELWLGANAFTTDPTFLK